MSPKLLSDNEKGERFGELRKRLGWGPTEAGRHLSVDPSDIGKYEKGTKPIPERVLADIAEAANETLAYFLPTADPVDLGRQQKLVIAKWLVDMAEQLRTEATAPPEGTTDVPVKIASAAQASGVLQPEDGKARRQK